jgi:hypothetical protein
MTVKSYAMSDAKGGVHADLDEAAWVEQEVDAFPGGELARGVLPRHGVLAAHRLRRGAATREVVGEVLHGHDQPCGRVAIRY